MNSILNIIYTLMKAIVLTILSALCVYWYDIASTLSFVPANRTFVISNGIYLAILIGIFSILENIYSENCLKYEMFFSPDSDRRDEKENPTVILRGTVGKAEFYIDIAVTGKDKYLKKNKVILYYPDIITIQPDVQQMDYVQVSSKDCKCVIDISKLVHEKSGEVKTTKSKVKLSLLQKKAFNGTEKTLDLVVECNWFVKKFLLTKKSNKLKIKIKD